MQTATAPGSREKPLAGFLRVAAHQHETLDDVLYRTTGNTAPIAQVMAANPHALHSPRLAEGTPVHIPRTPAAKPTPTVKLWE